MTPLSLLRHFTLIRRTCCGLSRVDAAREIGCTVDVLLRVERGWSVADEARDRVCRWHGLAWDDFCDRDRHWQIGASPRQAAPAALPAPVLGAFDFEVFAGALDSVMQTRKASTRTVEEQIGVSKASVSRATRATAGRPVGVETVLKLCAWMGRDPLSFLRKQRTVSVVVSHEAATDGRAA